MQKGILKKYLGKDPRIQKVIDSAKPIYDRANLPSHNFVTHITEVLHRALVIAEEDQLRFNPSILIPACLLHDIGYTTTLRKEGHEKASADYSERVLKEAGFNKTEIKKVQEAIDDGYFNPGKSLEGDILWDADILNQLGYGGMYSFFVSLYEYKNLPDGKNEIYRLDNFLKSRIEVIRKIEEMGLRTKAGKKMAKNGFSERADFIKKSLQGVKERDDFLVEFEDLI